ncbi:unnamed protein product [Paramecium sonneborni]|uniref:Transmembrane protein n=1 Tax=Paramecium sonneborni TaxID=65129 RepID=A0A8S1K3I5_9CILI|nr:unnamed protein product [Paramecium sonneborni]
MQQRDQVEDKKQLMYGIQDMFVRKSALTNTMQQVISITEPINNEKSSIEKYQLKIQENQLKYLLVLWIHFFVSLIIIGLLGYFNLSEQMEQIPFIIFFVLLMLYILLLAFAQFNQSFSKNQPQNVFLFSLSTIIRQFWFVYVIIRYPQLNLVVIISVIFTNLIIISICFHLDRQDGIKNCFLVSKQLWRISFVLLFEILFVGLYLDIQDAISAIIWILILYLLYSFILLNVQLVEFRKPLAKNRNIYLLSQLYFEGDLVFPCYFFKYHMPCCSKESILR